MRSPVGLIFQERRQSFESLSRLSQKGNACCRVRGCVKTISISLWGVEVHAACSVSSSFFFLFFSNLLIGLQMSLSAVRRGDLGN